MKILRSFIPLVMLVALLAGALPSMAPAASAGAPTLNRSPPLIINHRGASGYLPEETLEAYRLAVAMQAEFLECDVYISKDGVPVLLHDGTLNATTNVVAYAAVHPDIYILGRDVDTTRTYDVTEFTFAQLQALTATCRNAFGYCTDRSHFDPTRHYRIISLVQLADFVHELYVTTGRIVGLYPETKQEGDAVADMILAVLQDPKYGGLFDGSKHNVILQSFDARQLRHLRGRTKLPLVQLGICPGDVAAAQAIEAYADGVGPPTGKTDSACVAAAHAAGLFVHPYTFLNDPSQYATYFAMGVDGVFSNFADMARKVRDR